MKIDYAGKIVLIRSRDAGVHFGEYLFHEGDEVHLKNSQRIWRWRGANTLNEVAIKGVDRTSYTRISEITDSIIIKGFCEILVLTNEAYQTMKPIWL